MNITIKTITTGLAAIVLTASAQTILANGGQKPDQNYCMDVEIEPFHMMPDMQPEGSCTVRDYWNGKLQQEFYPFTQEDHLFNCEYFGPLTPLPQLGAQVPSAVVSEGNIRGTIGGHPFEATLACASLTNWYQDSCADPANPESCSFQLAQPFLGQGLPFPRVTEVSVFDGEIQVRKNRKSKRVPIVMATRAAGITHLEDISAPLVGASITHSLLGMVIPGNDDRGSRTIAGSADLLLQGHIFFPGPVEDDVDEDGNNEAAVIKGSICSKKLYKMLN